MRDAVVQGWLDEAPSSQLLPDPPAAPRVHTIISVDDHLVEPPWLFDIHHRIRDMDLAGVWATVCFPSMLDGVAAADARAITCENAARVFRHPLPEEDT